MYLAVNAISKAYGMHQVLDQVSFILNDGQRLGLVGANGVGKSTLLKIITGELEADGGAVSLTPGARIGYLPQTIAAFGEKTLSDLIDESMQQLRQLERRMRELEQQMAESSDREAALVAYAEASEQFERRGGYEMAHRVDAVLGGLHVGHIERGRRLATLSGGEKSRVGLALLLLQAPDLLLLDEPTNHLDFASLAWLEDYLRAYRGAALIVSHDRHFLNRTVTAIVEIDEHSRRAKHYAGDYDAYLLARAQEREHWRVEYERQQEEIKALRHEIKLAARQVAHNHAPKDNDKFYKGFKQGRLSVAVSRRVGSAEEKLRRIEADPIPEPPEALHFEADFDPAALKSHVALSVSGLAKAFGSLRLASDLSFTLGARGRVALVGPNGSGKSTLLKLLAGLLPPDDGAILVNPQVKIGYLDQENEQLNPDRTVFETYRDGLPGPDQQHKSILLGSGLFRYEELERPVGQLSSGQKRKLQIARLMAERANLLLLDEPTNYVSFDILESVETALRAFPGTIVAASHDRRFLERFGGEIWELRAGSLIRYLDGYAGYMAALESPQAVVYGG